MEFGVGIFFTDCSISPAELAVALEERGFDSLWAPEHSHIPVPRRTPFPGGGEVPKPYYEGHGSVRRAQRGGSGHQDSEARYRRVPRRAARPDPDGKAGCFDRSDLGRALP